MVVLLKLPSSLTLRWDSSSDSSLSSSLSSELDETSFFLAPPIFGFWYFDVFGLSNRECEARGAGKDRLLHEGRGSKGGPELV